VSDLGWGHLNMASSMVPGLLLRVATDVVKCLPPTLSSTRLREWACARRMA
jgi:hypothetical protein